MKISFTKNNGPLDEIIEKLMETAEGIGRQKYVREMILASLKAGQEADENADLKLMNTTLKEMRFTSKVFGPYRNVRKVTVFGSARTLPGDPVYEMAKLFGKKLAETGYMVITGGGGGIMQAVNEGAGPEHSFGVNIRLPFEEKPNPVSEETRGSSRTSIFSTAKWPSSKKRMPWRSFRAASARSTRPWRRSPWCKRANTIPCRSCSWTIPTVPTGHT